MMKSNNSFPSIQVIVSAMEEMYLLLLIQESSKYFREEFSRMPINSILRSKE